MILLLGWCFILNTDADAQKSVYSSNGYPNGIGDYYVRTWTVHDGLPSNSVLRILQTQDGYLWFATDGGLARFDGIDFHVFTLEDLPGWERPFVVSLYESQDGTLWIGSSRGDLARWEGHRFKTYPLNVPREHASGVIHWLEDTEGSLWVATYAGALRLKDDQLTLYTTKEGLPSDIIEHLFQDEHGTVWAVSQSGLAQLEDDRFKPYGPVFAPIAFAYYSTQRRELWFNTVDGHIHRFKEGVFSTFPFEEIAPVEINCAYEDNQGLLSLCTTAGVLEWGGMSFTHYPITGRLSDPVQNLRSRRAGGLWVQSQAKQGLALFQNGIFHLIDLREILPYAYLMSIYEDREGNVWVGSEGGLICLTPYRFQSFTTKDGLPQDDVQTIHQDPSGAIWIGSAGGLSRLKDGNIMTTYTRQDGLISNGVYALHEHAFGGLWVGTHRGGIAHIQSDRSVDQRFSHIRSPEVSVYALEVDHEGTLWAGGHSFLARITGDSLSFEGPEELLVRRTVRDIHEDRSGMLWVATSEGLYRLNEGTWRLFTTQDGLSSHYVVSIFESSDGALWFGTHGGGLNRYWEGRFTAYNTKNGLHDDVVWSMLDDDFSHFWLCTNTGIARVDQRELVHLAEGAIDHLRPIVYTESDGLPSGQCRMGHGQKAKDGTLWFPTRKGAAVINPDDLKENRQVPPVHIQKLRADGIEVNDMEATRLGPGVTNLEFHFTALSYTAPEKNRYLVKLEGYDKDWVDVDTRRVAYYTNLDPGKYTFRVIAANNDGVWNEVGASVEIGLLPHFYQTGWFFLLIIGSLTTCTVAVFWLRRQQLLLQFEGSRQRIAADLHDDIGSKVGSLAMFLDYVSKKHYLKEEDRIQLRDHVDAARRLGQDLRDTIWIVDSDLDYLHSLLERMQQTAHRMLPTCAVHFDAPPEVPKVLLSMEWRRAVYFIYKEALYNAARHARATQVSIHITIQANGLTICLEDNGVGFDMECVRQGRGLKTLRMRTAEIEGELTILSQKGIGTVVRLQTSFG